MAFAIACTNEDGLVCRYVSIHALHKGKRRLNIVVRIQWLMYQQIGLIMGKTLLSHVVAVKVKAGTVPLREPYTIKIV